MVANLHAEAEFQKVKVRGNIFLRPLEQSDAFQLLKILSADPIIRDRVIVSAELHTKKDVKAMLAKMQADPGLMHYVLVEDGHLVGLVSLWRDNGFFGEPVNPNRYGFGYFLDPAARGKGLITASVRSLMNTLSKNLKVDQFISYCEDDNVSSKAVLERLGFVPNDKTFREPTHGWIEREYTIPIR
jgi:RimJ/RimL family protein N-acetyltransferase